MDRISRLPDEILCHILSFLSTKHAVATSILSSRWVNLWKFLTVIDLDDSLYLNPLNKYLKSRPVFVDFVDGVWSLNQSPTIVKFRLHMYNYHGLTLSGINGFIQNVILRNVVEVHLRFFDYDLTMDDYQLKIPHSQSLKVLKINTNCCLKFPACFPSLRVFDVVAEVYSDDEWITNLFPCLPALEKLCLVANLVDCYGEFKFNICGAALTHLEIELLGIDYSECDAVVDIDAPNLEYLRVKDEFLASYVVKNKPAAISEARLQVGDYGMDFLQFLDEVGPTRHTRFSELLQGLVNTKFISVSANTLRLVFSQRWNIPVLPSLTKLELEVDMNNWIQLLRWLESCPNLKVLSLIMTATRVQELEELMPDVVPSCLSSCIKEIEIKRLGKVDHEKMLIYLLYNAKVLDKFTVDSRVCVKDGIVQ